MIIKRLIEIFVLALIATACSGKEGSSIELSGLNYTDVGIAMFAVDDYAGHGIEANGGGGKFVCCVAVPRRWHAGMKVTVRWTEDSRVPDLWKQRVVEVPRYTEQDIGIFAVHFYPDGSVKVLVTTMIEGHAKYPYPRARQL